MSNAAPLPVQDRVTGPDGRIALTWLEFLTAQSTALNTAAARVQTVRLTAQGASIGTTPIPGPALAGGLYRISVYARITRAATVSSSLTPTITWTENGISLSESFAAVTGNTTTTVLTGPPKLVNIDGVTPISYATTYASVGGTSMQYELILVLEKVDA